MDTGQIVIELTKLIVFTVLAWKFIDRVFDPPKTGEHRKEKN